MRPHGAPALGPDRGSGDRLMHGTITRPDPGPRRLPLILRLALRELRAGLTGFAVFLACIA
ncbi:hypothetical protein, partial [Methylobacterium sp. B1]|uniref:hypothetical protein n=1 Tax=Methylobacterium sp. B1 TaxID=91459 RepID=UPI0035B56370